MMNFLEIKKISQKVYKFKKKYQSYWDVKEVLEGPKSDTDLYYWICSGMPITPKKPFTKSIKFHSPKIRI